MFDLRLLTDWAIESPRGAIHARVGPSARARPGQGRRFRTAVAPL